MFGVVKRDGTVTDFNLTKISDAIMKAFNATDVQYRRRFSSSPVIPKRQRLLFYTEDSVRNYVK